MRKRICVLLAQLEEKTQNRFMRAFTKEAYAHDYDICIFSMYQKYQETDLRNVGDSNIYSLANLAGVDAVVILLDTILTPDFDKKLLKRVKQEFDGPVFVIDRETEEFDYILIDHYTPILKIMNHLIDDHGYKDIAFLGGKVGHPHSVQRFNAYLNALKSHHIPIRNDRIFHGDYWYNTGDDFAKKLLENRDDMPEAVMCANEYMAIGLAATLTKNGFKVPDDIAVAAYDSTIEGETSPVPLTTAEIPADKCGALCFARLHAAITKETCEEPDLSTEIILGGSCGCKDFKAAYRKINRDTWENDHSQISFKSDFNHFSEDLLCQKDYMEFFKTIASYSYQVRPFENLYICLNDNFTDPYSFIGPLARREGYGDKIHTVIKVSGDSDADNSGAVDYTRKFDSIDMLPELYEERDYPTTFIFTPLFFDDRCFGYAVINYGKEVRFYTEIYRSWLKNVNEGIEAFYRQKALTALIDQIKAQQIRDRQTGLFNYQGFREGLSILCEDNIKNGRSVAIIALDIDKLSNINEKYNRFTGDSAIQALAKFLSTHTYEREICARLTNDEFLVGLVHSDCEKRYKEFLAEIPENGILFHDESGNEHRALLHNDIVTERLDKMPDLDSIINKVVNAKNHNKKIKTQKELVLSELSKEEKDKCKEVEKILDNNLLSFFFQPIVKVCNGEIFGYEALMRYEGDMELTPSEILSCAASLNRLYDIEKTSFNGVIDCMENNPMKFISKKVFINSLPAHQLEGKDEEELFARFKRHLGRIVVEYNEISEFRDEAMLNKRKEDYLNLYIEIALDDYGSGYSNVNNLIRYSPRYIKIDHDLIHGINESAQKRHFVKNIISYASKSNISVIAEGVETEEELKAVIDLGVDLVQGFYTGTPKKDAVQKIDNEVSAKIKRFTYAKCAEEFDPEKIGQ